jgi:hypothetical protein
MKQKKSVNKKENVVDFKGIMDQKKRNDICDLDYEEFKFAITQILLSMVEAMGENNKKIDKSFQRLIEHLKSVSEEQKFMKQVLYMERILNGEHRDGPMTMEQKASLSEAFGLDFNEFVKQASRKGKSSRNKKSSTIG